MLVCVTSCLKLINMTDQNYLSQEEFAKTEKNWLKRFYSGEELYLFRVRNEKG